MMNLETFLKEKQLIFDSDKQGISWVKRNLKPDSLLKVGPNYLVDEAEIEKLFQNYIEKKKRKERMKKEKAVKLKAAKNSKKEADTLKSDPNDYFSPD